MADLEIELLDLVFTELLLSGKPTINVCNDTVVPGDSVTLAEVCTLDPTLPRSGRRVFAVVSSVAPHALGLELVLSKLGAA